eukprot:7127444-Pyramimonas_sp.AAC.1
MLCTPQPSSSLVTIPIGSSPQIQTYGSNKNVGALYVHGSGLWLSSPGPRTVTKRFRMKHKSRRGILDASRIPTSPSRNDAQA